ncbi:MAG: thiol:disulfide interchange protein [Thermoleophilia bacterium]|nr:thiol:disulfide interchange protein [Thermoleophilia bacterium]
MDDVGAEGSTEAPAAPRGRWGTIGWIACSAVLIALVGGIWLKVDHDRAGASLANAIIDGERPPAPALPTSALKRTDGTGLPAWYRASGENQSRKAPGAKILVVNWWASWCGPCKDEAPALRAIAKDYRATVTVVGMNASAQDLESDARAFAKEYELDFVLLRAGRAHEDAWGINGFPETFVVGTDGRISSLVNGPVDEDTLRGLLDAELDEDRA